MATYHGPQQARRALQELKRSGVRESNLSFLSRDDEGEVERAATILEGVGADRIDRFDAKGRPRS